MKIYHHYNESHSPSSAREIVPKLINLLNPHSVIDVGCGLGQWLSVFSNCGVDNIHGFDGSHVSAEDLFIPKNRFTSVNLFDVETIFIKSKFDLVLCLEVAEHLPESCADSFVEFLIKCGDTIVFSAAIPGQTGENHYNEQWPTYWEQKFKKHGYIFFDLIRKDIWNNENVNWWYRQNMFIVSKSVEIYEKYNSYLYDGQLIVHPELLKMYIYMNTKKVIRKNIYDKLKLVFRWMRFQ
jgi:hypothetical protein